MMRYTALVLALGLAGAAPAAAQDCVAHTLWFFPGGGRAPPPRPPRTVSTSR
jgi:hypothetical protein